MTQLVRQAEPESPLVRATTWPVAEFDAAACADLLGWEPAGGADLASLRSLHRAHVARVAFENLDVVLGRVPSLDPGALVDKVVHRHRGGYCYELNSLFGALLDALGFPTRRVLARIGDPAQQARPRSHLVGLVAAEGRWWIADVGFGSGPLEPVPLDGETVRQGGWTWRVVRGPEGWWRVQQLQERWETQYTLADEATYRVDVEVANHNTATSPTSPFTRRPIVVQRSAEEERRLVGRTLAVRRPDGSETSRLVGDAEYGEVLGSFGLRPSQEEVAAVVASLSPQG
ncbi:arylamine N-acetyltransferase family protein [Kineococcus glutinatus]|uniref:Arylamine N-acetyltransferase n=1 Tax=Kineococcus glutinatus TaxID=1070872 RepID=A0ABP9HT08_9ACTN